MAGGSCGAWLEVVTRPANTPGNRAGGSAHLLSTILSVHEDCQERNCREKNGSRQNSAALAADFAGDGRNRGGGAGEGAAGESEPGSGAICGTGGEIIAGGTGRQRGMGTAGGGRGERGDD